MREKDKIKEQEGLAKKVEKELFLMKDDLILASLSVCRAQLLKKAGFFFRVEAAGIDERVVERKYAQLSPRQKALKLAEAKAFSVFSRFPEALIIGCDQILEFDGKILHKPVDREEVRLRLKSFCDRIHQLHSAVCLVFRGENIWDYVGTAHMKVRSLSPSFITDYLSSVGDEVLKSPGCYQLEEEGIRLFEKIEGDYFSILGLPLLPLLSQLRILGVLDD